MQTPPAPPLPSMQRKRCVGKGNRPCSLPDVGVCFCGRPLGGIITQGVVGAGEEAQGTNLVGDYVCRQFELLYPEEPHTSYLVASLQRALAATPVFKDTLPPQNSRSEAAPVSLEPHFPAAATAAPVPTAAEAAAAAPPFFQACEGAPRSSQPVAWDGPTQSRFSPGGAGLIPGAAPGSPPADARRDEAPKGSSQRGRPQAGDSQWPLHSSPVHQVEGRGAFPPFIPDGKKPRVQYCYELARCLGVGASGQVYECIQRDVQYNLKPTRVVAAKLVRNTPAHICNGLNELFVYQILPKTEKPHNVIELLDFFVYRRHVCFILEIQQLDLYKVLEAGKFKGLPLPCVQRVAAQIANTLRVATEAKITHFDLKPENILISFNGDDDHSLRGNAPSRAKVTQGNWESFGASTATTEESDEAPDEFISNGNPLSKARLPSVSSQERLDSLWIKVIDFSASRLWTHRAFPRATRKEEHEQYVKDIVAAARGTPCYRIQTRYYGAPELLLGIPYYKVVDVWSMGCILAELVLGVPLFPGVSHFDLLRRITRLCGSVPTWILDNGSRVWKFYVRDVVLSLPPVVRPAGGGDAEAAADETPKEGPLTSAQEQQQRTEEEPSTLLYPIGASASSHRDPPSCLSPSIAPVGLPRLVAGTIGRDGISGPACVPVTTVRGCLQGGAGVGSLREMFASAGEMRGVCSRAVSECVEAENEGTPGSDLGSRAAAALQLVRCFDRATEGGACRYRLPRAALGGNPNSLFCAANDAAADSGMGRATVAFSGVEEEKEQARDEPETEKGWRMLSVPEYEKKHNKTEPTTVDFFNIRKIRDILRARADNGRGPRVPCAACNDLRRTAAAAAAASAAEMSDSCRSEECRNCRSTRIQEEQLAADFVDFLERALVIDPLIRMTPEEAVYHPFVSRLQSSLAAGAIRGPQQPWGVRHLDRLVGDMQEQLEALLHQQQQQQQEQQQQQQQTHAAGVSSFSLPPACPRAAELEPHGPPGPDVSDRGPCLPWPSHGGSSPMMHPQQHSAAAAAAAAAAAVAGGSCAVTAGPWNLPPSSPPVEAPMGSRVPPPGWDGVGPAVTAAAMQQQQQQCTQDAEGPGPDVPLFPAGPFCRSSGLHAHALVGGPGPAPSLAMRGPSLAAVLGSSPGIAALGVSSPLHGGLLSSHPRAPPGSPAGGLSPHHVMGGGALLSPHSTPPGLTAYQLLIGAASELSLQQHQQLLLHCSSDKQHRRATPFLAQQQQLNEFPQVSAAAAAAGAAPATPAAAADASRGNTPAKRMPQRALNRNPRRPHSLPQQHRQQQQQQTRGAWQQQRHHHQQGMLQDGNPRQGRFMGSANIPGRENPRPWGNHHRGPQAGGLGQGGVPSPGAHPQGPPLTVAGPTWIEGTAGRTAGAFWGVGYASYPLNPQHNVSEHQHQQGRGGEAPRGNGGPFP